jgi:hypothetical protein
VRQAERLGARIFGLGTFTKVVGVAGLRSSGHHVTASQTWSPPAHRREAEAGPPKARPRKVEKKARLV